MNIQLMMMMMWRGMGWYAMGRTHERALARKKSQSAMRLAGLLY